MKTPIQLLTLLFLLILNLSASATTPLPTEQAFTLSTKFFGNDTIVLTWNIAPDHYLYKDRISFKIIEPNSANIGAILMPNGQLHENELFDKYETYSNRITIPIPIINLDPKETLLAATYQGCAKSGYCYPPTTQIFNISLNNHTITPVATTRAILPTRNADQEQRYITLLSSHYLITILLGFLGFGILLSFTPCVLPMLPILSGIILGHKKTMSTAKACRLSSVYVLSMALTYAAAGMLVGFIGNSVQTLFQQTWILILSSVIFVLLALSFFGFYQLKLPAKLEMYLSNISRKQKAGHYLGVAIMGCLATLIISPCVTPALVGVLGYIGQTGDMALGGMALFAMGLGMGIPLIIVGTTGGKLLPKAGRWMQTLEHCFGVFFLGMAIWILDRVLPPHIIIMLYATLLVVSSVYMGVFSTASSGWSKLWKGLGLVFFIYGVLLFVGATQGNTHLFQPLRSAPSGSVTHEEKDLFTRVSNLSQLKEKLDAATAQGKPVLLDFYADWCISCKEMAQTTFKDPNIIKALSNFSVLQVDMTQNNAEDNALMHAFNVIAPPTLIFFGKDGQQLKGATLVGKINTAELVAHLEKIQ
ncbi:MAG: thiol:disulfide interchange protein [Gammaproteobacteria bacterium]|nr:thiol:disulfide interchange protein [Gammaproteobacteria bacterium]